MLRDVLYEKTVMKIQNYTKMLEIMEIMIQCFTKYLSFKCILFLALYSNE